MTRTLRPLATALTTLNVGLTLTGRNLAAVLVAAMALIVLAQIGLRAVFGSTLSWAEETTRIMLVWSGFLIAPYAHRIGANIAIDMFVAALPSVVQRSLAFTIQGLVILICAIFLGQSIGFVERGMAINASTLPIKIGFAYLAAPIGFAGLILVSVELVVREILKIVDAEGDWAIKPDQIVVPPE